MNGTIDWGQFVPNENSSNVNYLKMESGGTYKIRPIAKPVVFYRYFYKHDDGSKRNAICKNPKDCPVGMQYKDILTTPNVRFAMLCIDRADQQIKIIEYPKTIFNAMTSWFKQTGVKPGSKEAYDWSITKNGVGLKTTYEAMALPNPTSITPEEEDRINAILFNEDGSESNFLANIYKPHSPEEIMKRLFGDGNDSNNSSGSTNDVNASSTRTASNPVNNVQNKEQPVSQVTQDFLKNNDW